jgi:hypothetical protein
MTEHILNKRREASRKWRRLHLTQARANSLAHYHKNKVRYRDNLRRWRASKSPAAVAHRLAQNLRHLLKMAMRRTKLSKAGKTLDLLGCEIGAYKQYLEALFLPGMSWENRSAWHIDHIKPICSFDLSTLAGQKAAFHYTNTQPLWAVDNWRKGGLLI